ncbi:LptF/LptG family permease [Balneolaceae bacterium ANBcel3]|nr:LptF/LptG family permease [Balneolaceae bacterium ANBcel3]
MSLSFLIQSFLPGSIERDLLKRHIAPFIFCFCTIMFLLLMQFLIQYMDHLVGKGIPLMVILELIVVNLAYMVVLAVPMTILAASLIAYGRFAEQNEFTALRAAGVHPFRIMRPVILISVLITTFLAWFSNEVLPEANYKARALFIDIRMKKPGFDLQEGTFYEGIDGYTFLVRRISQETDSLYDVTLFQNAQQGRDRAVIKAKRGRLESDERHLSMTLFLYDGSVLRYLNASGRSSSSLVEETLFDSYRISFDLSDLSFSRTNPESRRRDGRSMRAQAMLAAADSLRMEMNDLTSRFNQTLWEHSLSFKADTTIDTGEEIEFIPLSSKDDSSTESKPPNVSLQRIQIDTVPPKKDPALYSLTALSSLHDQKKITSESLIRVREHMVRSEELKNNLRWRQERVARFMVEVHKKVSIPFGCILFALLGAPLGLLVRKGNMGIHTLISTGLFTYYWIGIIQGEKLADRLFISPFMGMWFTNITMLVAALVVMFIVFTRR